MLTVAILTISDKCSAGIRHDKTGEDLINLLEKNHYQNIFYEVIPDDLDLISEKLKFIADNIKPNLILTNGGTGFSIRDNTPEATQIVIEKQIPGISEYMRLKSSEITLNAILSRGICGIRGKSIIVNLPGSPKGATENISFVLTALNHGILILTGESAECARTD